MLGYSEIELCMKGSGYQFIHAADMMHCADNHIRSMLAIQSQPSNDVLQRSYCRLRSCIRP